MRDNLAPMRLVLLVLLAVIVAGCGAEVTNTVIQPVSMCTAYLRGHAVRVTIQGLDADRLCRQYGHNRRITGEHWTTTRPTSAPDSLPTACRLTSTSGETEVIVADTPADGEGATVCEQWRSAGWINLSRFEG